MDIQEILQQLATNTGTFPRDALTHAIAQREAIIPELLRVLEEAPHHIDRVIASQDMTHIYAMYLLAQFREPRAYPLLVAFFSMPGDLAFEATGDVVATDLGRMFASVSGGDIRLLTTVVENPQGHEEVRGAALHGLLTLMVCGEYARDDLIAYYQQLFRGTLVREGSWVWTELVLACMDLYPDELYEDITHAYDDDLIETDFLPREDIDRTLTQEKARVLDALQHHRRYSLITDTITELAWGSGFHPEGRAVPSVVPGVQPPGKHSQRTSKEKHKRKLVKAARRRNRR